MKTSERDDFITYLLYLLIELGLEMFFYFLKEYVGTSVHCIYQDMNFSWVREKCRIVQDCGKWFAQNINCQFNEGIRRKQVWQLIFVFIMSFQIAPHILCLPISAAKKMPQPCLKLKRFLILYWQTQHIFLRRVRNVTFAGSSCYTNATEISLGNVL